MVRVTYAETPALRELLAAHPRVSLELGGEPGAALRFEQNGWRRAVVSGPFEALSPGIAELSDNNPWVCADCVAVPGAAGTLAAIALGPLIRAGSLVEAPTLITNAAGPKGDIVAALESLGWLEGATIHHEAGGADSVVAATALAVVRTPADLAELDDVYEEVYGRSFYVRRDEASPWGPELVRSSPRAVYRLRVTPDEPNSLLTIAVMADSDGKCGAAQIVHAMNVMAGFEESLGMEAVPSIASKS